MNFAVYNEANQKVGEWPNKADAENWIQTILGFFPNRKYRVEEV